MNNQGEIDRSQSMRELFNTHFPIFLINLLNKSNRASLYVQKSPLLDVI